MIRLNKFRTTIKKFYTRKEIEKNAKKNQNDMPKQYQTVDTRILQDSLKNERGLLAQTCLQNEKFLLFLKKFIGGMHNKRKEVNKSVNLI